MTIKIQKASRQKTKMRLLLSWASGSGKTYSALLVAKGLAWGDMSKVCVIDTEHNSSSLYSNLWDFSVVQIDPNNCTTDILCEAFDEIEKAGFTCIVRDSSSHWRNEILELNDNRNNEGYYPLLEVIYNNNIEMVKLILEYADQHNVILELKVNIILKWLKGCCLVTVM